MRWKRTLFVLVAAFIGFGVMAAYWIIDVKPPGKTSKEEVSPAPVSIDVPFVTIVDPSKGPKDAKITIVEFGNHACPYCKSAQETIDRLLKAHPTEVRFVWKSAPSPLHPGTDTAAASALCAERQGKFWEYHAGLFENAGAFDQASMAILANELNLDSASFNECLTQDLTLPLVERTITEARALGVTSLPTIFINGTRYEGALSYDQLLEATGL